MASKEVKGFHTPQGYLGEIGKDKWQLFPTEEEYEEYCKEQLKESEKE